MDVTDDISSTCENDKSSKLFGHSSDLVSDKEELKYDCESEDDYDSENETIDIMCENSKLAVARYSDKNQRIMSLGSNQDRICFFEQTRVQCPSKATNARNSCHNSGFTLNNTKHAINSLNNSKSKTFLIDNILGNNKSSISKLDDAVVNEESDNLEETADEHNVSSTSSACPELGALSEAGLLAGHAYAHWLAAHQSSSTFYVSA